ncbi:dTDP-4-dehydrorhamnose reductase [Psychromonas ingrahamii 37]|uniref:dTDP-4-dehydrorhamnose reductase n=1 Tax=Psychromonas ingrahamii (strain DSM 17664 / CCUG 51855 / 37) TaxID=357804 RepID=A1T081_PSYIN|nr:dTDP-4-dehydrorhamnose reductase [Psychromonas ingrahamii]ABM05146.1 dTDP-4-dehydrorhamnose reductase [Psychromonas ingrahamii 37]
MRVLITGSKGQVGHCLTEQLRNYTDAQFLALDSKGLDITDQSAVQAVVNEFKPTIIINAAAYTAVDRAEDESDLAYAINRDGAKYLAEAAQSVNAVILHISTDYVFSGDKEGMYTEADLTSPQGIYGESKLAGEKAVIEACSRHIILRTAWVFGEHGNNFVKIMLRLAKTHDTLGIVGDQFGGPTYAGDIASALVTVAKTLSNGDNDKYGIYHYSGFPHVSWSQFAQAIFDEAVQQTVLKQSPVVNSITTADYPTPAKRPANSKLSTTLIKDKFGVNASDWKAALQNIKAYTNI